MSPWRRTHGYRDLMAFSALICFVISALPYIEKLAYQ
jgi:hypothetical protein